MIRTKRRALFDILLWATSGCAVFVAGVLVYGLYVEKPFLHYQNLPFPPLVKQVQPGSTIPLEVERCSRSNEKQTYVTTRRLVHVPKAGEEKLKDVLLESKTVDIAPGCHREVSKLNEAPPKTSAGAWFVTGLALVKGVLRVHPVEWYSATFEIVEAEK